MRKRRKHASVLPPDWPLQRKRNSLWLARVTFDTSSPAAVFVGFPFCSCYTSFSCLRIFRCRRSCMNTCMYLFPYVCADRENLQILFQHYAINDKLGLSRPAWISMVTSLGIEDDEIVCRNDTEAVFDEVRARKVCSRFDHSTAHFSASSSLSVERALQSTLIGSTQAVPGINFEEFLKAFAMLSEIRFTPPDGVQVSSNAPRFLLQLLTFRPTIEAAIFLLPTSIRIVSSNSWTAAIFNTGYGP